MCVVDLGTYSAHHRAQNFVQSTLRPEDRQKIAKVQNVVLFFQAKIDVYDSVQYTLEIYMFFGFVDGRRFLACMFHI